MLLCDIVLAGSGVALLATGCQSQRGGGLRPVAPPPLNTPLVTIDNGRKDGDAVPL